MGKRIFIKDWLDLKPYSKQARTDGYYLKICNEIKKAIVNNEEANYLQILLLEEGIDYLSCFLTSYFEDILSGTNIWNSFVRIHKRLYHKPLPFYNVDEYYEEEINVQDVSFLIWYFISLMRDDIVVSPLNGYIIEAAEEVMTIFEDAWDNAPENKQLISYYQIDKKDFHVARNLIQKILFETYLFHPDTAQRLKELREAIIEEHGNNEELEYGDVLAFLYEVEDYSAHAFHTGLFGFKGKEWAAEILGNDHPLSEDFLNLSPTIKGLFLYKGQDKDELFVEHIASSKRFKIKKYSFHNPDSLKKIDTIMYMGIVEWRNEWWLTGVSINQPFDPDIILEEKNSIASKREVHFLDDHKKKDDDFLIKQLKAFKDFNKGAQIVFLPTEQINEYMKNFIIYYTHSLDAPKKAKKEALKRIIEKDFFIPIEELKETAEASETCLLFYNPKSGMEIGLHINSAFPLPNNPYFEEEQSDEDIMALFTSDELSTELAMFCIENCKDKLPFFDEGDIGAVYLKEIDFLLRFWKGEKYFTKPMITHIEE